MRIDSDGDFCDEDCECFVGPGVYECHGDGDMFSARILQTMEDQSSRGIGGGIRVDARNQLFKFQLHDDIQDVLKEVSVRLRDFVDRAWIAIRFCAKIGRICAEILWKVLLYNMMYAYTYGVRR